MNAAEPVLRLEAVGKSYQSPAGPVRVLDGVDLSVREGEFVAITGPSGSGKTTLINLAGLLDRPTSGRVFLDGHCLATDGSDAEARRLRRERPGMVFQRFFLLPRRSVLDNVLFRFRYVRHDPIEARARALAEIGRAHV